MSPLVSVELYERYGAALGAASDIAEAAIRKCAGMSAAELETAYVAIVTRLAGVTAEVAREFYEAQRQLEQDLEGYEPQAYAKADEPLLLYDVRNNAAAALAGMAQQRIMESADYTIMQNLARDPASPRWALVPHAGACSWCQLIGSNGFRYRSEAAADASRHPHCRCSLVVDFDTDSPHLAGYDDSELFKRYANARSKAKSQAEADWAAMPEADKAAFKGATHKGRGAYDRFLRNRIVAQMRADQIK